MASSDTKSGFRLPWSNDRSHDESAPEGADVTPEAVEEPAADELAWPDANIEARLGFPTNGQRPPAETARDEAAPDAAATDAAATDTEAPEESQRMLEIESPSAPAAAKKPSKLMADLSAAILATAAAARDQALEQLDADAKQVTESIREGAVEGGTTLRKRSDDDVAGIRDWSKAEIARIREETDGRIATRKAQLEAELTAHASSVNNRVEEVQFEVDRFRSDMEEYFERLASQEDPSKLATMVEAMPDLPSFDAWADIDPLTDLPVVEAEADEAPVAEAEAVGEIEAVAEDAPEAVAEVADQAEGVADTAEPVADEAESGEISDGSFNVDATDEAEPAVGELDVETEEPAPAVSKGWGEGEGEWGGRAEDGGAVWAEGETPEGFPTGAEGGDPVDRGAIMAALEAAAEAVVAAEAAADSADHAEASADIAETAAELVVGRNSTEDSPLDPEAQAALDARVDAGGFEESYADRLASLLPTPAGADGEPKTTQVVVSGLVSVASIASFKRHLGRLSGVTSVAVASGPEGEFVFNVTHRPDVSFRDAIPTMPGFAARVTGTADGMINVAARDPESES